MNETVYCGTCSRLMPIMDSAPMNPRDFNGDLGEYAKHGATIRRAMLPCEHFVLYVTKIK